VREEIGVTSAFKAQLLALPGATALETRRDGLWMLAPEIDVVAMATFMHRAEGRLSTVTGVAREDGETDLIYHYIIGRGAINVKARTKGNGIASIANVTQSANWIEREIHDLYSVNFVGHPDLSPLVRPVQLPEGFFRER